jgi:hypothetical protein
VTLIEMPYQPLEYGACWKASSIVVAVAAWIDDSCTTPTDGVAGWLTFVVVAIVAVELGAVRSAKEQTCRAVSGWPLASTTDPSFRTNAPFGTCQPQ